MARGAWDATANLMWILAEVNRDREEHPEPYTPADFHPFRVKETPAESRADILPYNPAVMEELQKKWSG